MNLFRCASRALIAGFFISMLANSQRNLTTPTRAKHAVWFGVRPSFAPSESNSCRGSRTREAVAPRRHARQHPRPPHAARVVDVARRRVRRQRARRAVLSLRATVSYAMARRPMADVRAPGRALRAGQRRAELPPLQSRAMSGTLVGERRGHDMGVSYIWVWWKL